MFTLEDYFTGDESRVKRQEEKKLEREKEKELLQKEIKRKRKEKFVEAKNMSDLFCRLSPGEHYVSYRFLNFLSATTPFRHGEHCTLAMLRVIMDKCSITNFYIDEGFIRLQFMPMLWDWTFERQLWIAHLRNKSSLWFSLPKDIVLNIIGIVHEQTISALSKEEESESIIKFISEVNFTIAFNFKEATKKAFGNFWMRYRHAAYFDFMPCYSYQSSLTGVNVRKFGKKTKEQYSKIRIQHLLLEQVSEPGSMSMLSPIQLLYPSMLS